MWRTDRQTDGQTEPFIELLGRSWKAHNFHFWRIISFIFILHKALKIHFILITQTRVSILHCLYCYLRNISLLGQGISFCGKTTNYVSLWHFPPFCTRWKSSYYVENRCDGIKTVINLRNMHLFALSCFVLFLSILIHWCKSIGNKSHHWFTSINTVCDLLIILRIYFRHPIACKLTLRRK